MPPKKRTSGSGGGAGGAKKAKKGGDLPSIAPDALKLPHMHLFDAWLNL